MVLTCYARRELTQISKGEGSGDIQNDSILPSVAPKGSDYKLFSS